MNDTRPRHGGRISSSPFAAPLDAASSNFQGRLSTLPRVLVLLATYNGAKFIAEQLRSLAAQRDVRLRVLASDDGSRDGTVEVASRVAYEGGLPLEFLPEHEPSGSAAKNFWRLFDAATMDDCDYVALCDQDDIWLEDKMCRAAFVLENFPEAGYSCNSIAFWPDGSQKKIKKNYPQRQWDYLFESASHGCTYVLTAPAARQFQAFVRAKGSALDGIEFHDMLIYAWARARNMPWIMDDRHLIRYRQSGGNVIGANSGFRAIRTRIGKLRQGWLRSQALKIVQILEIGDAALPRRLKNYGYADRLGLALRSRQCRRRTRDAAVFLLNCLAGL